MSENVLNTRPVNADSTPQILVVDDEPDMQALIQQKFRRMIRKGELQFYFAENGVKALEVLADNSQISMVISDINMPEMDGLTLLGQLKTLNPNIRSVIVSAYGDLQNIRTAMNRGAYDFLTKPIDFVDFQTTLEKTLQHLAEVRQALQDRDRLVSIHHELNIARDIQQNAVPHTFPGSEQFEIHGSMTAARQIGGDFYDCITLADGRIGLVVGDVSGKGVPAALFMMVCQILLRNTSEHHSSPASLLRSINDQLLQNNPAMLFVTLFYGVYDPHAGSLCFAVGGHEAPIIIHADGQTRPVDFEAGTALGVFSDQSYAEQTLQLEPADALLVYTDGITDALNQQEQRFGEARLLEITTAAGSADAVWINQHVVNTVNQFATGVEQEDDMTCLVLKRNT